jgi:hypothetical protein
VSDREGKTKFYACADSSMSSSMFKRSELESCSEINVETKSLDTLFSELSINKVDLLKFDVEGAEFNIFKNSKKLNSISTLIGELHLDLINKTKNEFLEIFNNFDVKIEELSINRNILEINHKL